jgi:hypothetical protein
MQGVTWRFWSPKKDKSETKWRQKLDKVSQNVTKRRLLKTLKSLIYKALRLISGCRM